MSMTKEERKKTRKKLTSEDRVKFEMSKAQLLGIRAAKKTMRAKPLSAFSEMTDGPGKNNKKKKKNNKKRPVSGFEEELADIGASSVKKFRAGPSFKERKEATGSSKKAVQQLGRKKNHKKR